MIFDELERNGDAPALVTQDGSNITHRQLADAADRFAARLCHRALIFILCRNCPSAIIGYVGALRNRTVPLLINADINDEQLHNLINIYRPAYIWSERPIIGDIIFSDGAFSLCSTGFKPYPLNEHLAVLLSTSGSTGSPKLVRQSYENISANTASIIEYLRLTPIDRAITSMPMFYTYGLSIIQTQLNVGGSLVVTDSTMFQRTFWDTLKAQRVTNFGGVPYTFEMLKRLRFERMSLPTLRFITQAGGKLAPALTGEFVEMCRRKGIEYITMYGACEATARMSYVPWSRAVEKIGSIGIAIPGGRFAIDTANGETTQPDAEGELIYYGANVTAGYAEKAEDLSRADDNHGRLSTGDIARVDADGYFYITGRKKRFLKIFGNRISLDMVEAFLKSRGYLSSACAGVDDRLTVYTADTVDDELMRQLLSQYTGLHASAFKIVKVSAIPRNPSGKILYNQLEEYAI